MKKCLVCTYRCFFLFLLTSFCFCSFGSKCSFSSLSGNTKATQPTLSGNHTTQVSQASAFFVFAFAAKNALGLVLWHLVLWPGSVWGWSNQLSSTTTADDSRQADDDSRRRPHADLARRPAGRGPKGPNQTMHGEEGRGGPKSMPPKEFGVRVVF